MAATIAAAAAAVASAATAAGSAAAGAVGAAGSALGGAASAAGGALGSAGSAIGSALGVGGGTGAGGVGAAGAAAPIAGSATAVPAAATAPMSLAGGGVGAVPLGGSAAIPAAAPSSLAGGGVGLTSGTPGLASQSSFLQAAAAEAPASSGMMGLSGEQWMDMGKLLMNQTKGSGGQQSQQTLQPAPINIAGQQQRQRREMAGLVPTRRFSLR